MQAVYEDVRALTHELPTSVSHLKLKLKSSEMRALLAHGPVAFEDSASEGSATASVDSDEYDPEAWLPPSSAALASADHHTE